MDILSALATSDEYLLREAGIDTDKFKLGKLCSRKHDWQGTGKTLKRISNSACPECRGTKRINPPPVNISEEECDRLLTEAGLDPTRYRLRKLCKYSHNWNNTELSLRQPDVKSTRLGLEMGKCIECEKLRYQPPGGSEQYNDLLESNGIDPEVVALGQLCRKKHDWNNTGLSLRRKQANGLDRCIECESRNKSREGFNIGEQIRTVESRFYDCIDIRGEDECWPWLYHKSPKGYGRFNLGRSGKKFGFETNATVLSHRLMFLLSNGYLDPDLQVLHSCDFPACNNPRHLRQGTPAENSQDMYERDRSTYGTKNVHAKLTDDIVVEMRVLRWVYGWTCESISRKYDVTGSVVSLITRGLNWERTPGPICSDDADNWKNYKVA